jgi:LysM repeat protein
MKLFRQFFTFSTGKERLIAALLGLILAASCAIAGIALVVYAAIAATTRTTDVQFVVTSGSTLVPTSTQFYPISATLALPSPMPTATPFSVTPGQCPAMYAVRPGDTVLGIAILCHVTVDDIMRANNLGTSDSLKIGQELVIPAAGQAAAQPTLIPSNTPVAQPTQATVNTPTTMPTLIPIETPTTMPTLIPIGTPTPSPQLTPTLTPTLQPVQTPTDTPTPQSTLPSEAACTIDAWLSDDQPPQDADIIVFAELLCGAQPAVGAPMQTRWGFESGPANCDDGVTDEDGLASCTLNIGTAAIGYTVNVDVTIAWEEQTYQATVSFTPQ